MMSCPASRPSWQSLLVRSIARGLRARSPLFSVRCRSSSWETWFRAMNKSLSCLIRSRKVRASIPSAPAVLSTSSADWRLDPRQFVHVIFNQSAPGVRAGQIACDRLEFSEVANPELASGKRLKLIVGLTAYCQKAWQRVADQTLQTCIEARSSEDDRRSKKILFVSREAALELACPWLSEAHG